MVSTRGKLRLMGKVVGILLLAVVLALLGLLLYLSVREYCPEAVEPAWTAGAAQDQPAAGGELTLLTWNIGFAGLGEESDFFMDGGRMTRPTEAVSSKNLHGVLDTLETVPADIVLLQEVDVDSKRSYYVDQRAALRDAFAGMAAFAPNYVCDYVPYPIPDTIGRVESGVLTLSRFRMEELQRVSLPVPFSWPIRIANLKRCLLTARLPLAGTDAELVLVNLHLEAYDDGTVKRMQTEQLVQLLQEEYEAGNYVIAGGDFNQSFAGVGENYPLLDPDLWHPSTLERDILPSDWTIAFDDALPTCRLLNQPYAPDDPATQYYVIDGFLCSPNVTVQSVSTLDEGFQFADHNPVLLTVTLA